MAKLVIEIGSGNTRAKIIAGKKKGKKIQKVIDAGLDAMIKAEYEKPAVNLAAQILLRANFDSVEQTTGELKGDISNKYTIKGSKDELIDLVNASANYLVTQLSDELDNDNSGDEVDDDEYEEDEGEYRCDECDELFYESELTVVNGRNVCVHCAGEIQMETANAESVTNETPPAVTEEETVTGRGYCGQCDESVDVLSNGVCAQCGAAVEEVYDNN